MVICIITAIIFSAVRIYHLEFKNDVSAMLPNNTEVIQHLKILRNSNISDKIIISFYLNSDKHSFNELLKNVDKFSNSLNSPLISKIETGFSSNSPLNDLKNIIKLAPQIINKQKLNQIQNKITPESVNKLLKEDYKKLLSPGINLSTDLIRLDPLNIYSAVFSSLEQLSHFMGYKILLLNNHFISHDMKHAMMIIQTPVPVTDSGKSKQLITYLNKKLKNLPPFIKPNIISGHLHAISNEEIIKKDVSRILIISTIGFLLLFIFILKKDIRCLLLFILPVVSAFLSMALSSFFISEIAYFIIGMGGVITGISIDYGIHAYVAVNTSNNITHINKVAKPIIIGGLTTIGIFASFFFSDVTGYRQFAIFAIFSISISLILALFLLPQFLNKSKRIELNLPTQLKVKQKPIFHILIISCWICAICILTFFTLQQSIDSDIKNLNGSDNSIQKNENRFHQIWGGSNMPAILVTNSVSKPKLFALNEKLNKKISETIGKSSYYNLVSIWPSKKERINNINNWNKFWNKNKKDLKKLIIKYSPKYNFTAEAFNPFLNELNFDYKLENQTGKNSILDKLSKQFLYKKDNKYYMLSYFPDEKILLKKVKNIIKNTPNTFLLSKNNFSTMLSDSVSSEIIYLAAIAAIIIPLLSLLLLRNITQTILSLLPVISSIIAISGFLYLIGIKINAPIIIASLIAVGLSIDYGIFMVYHSIYNLKSGTKLATSLSALTTLIGALAVSFAKHPLLYNIGITLLIGVLTGYLVALFIIPAIIDSLPKLRKTKKYILFNSILILFSCLLLIGCQSPIPFKKPELIPIKNVKAQNIITNFINQTSNDFTAINSLVFNYRQHSFSYIGISKIDLKNNSIIVVGLNQIGIKLFEIESNKGIITHKFLIDEFKRYKKFPKTIIEDINRIYFNNIPKTTAKIQLEKYKINFID
ncbi:MAG: hypothetical protein GY756_01205, partial [bacterium]|nr:hypothetical protein [bacterium]